MKTKLLVVVLCLMGFCRGTNADEVPPNWREMSPHDLLWNGFAEQALILMKEDSSWIRRRDSDRRTPLHIAARFEHAEVVDWLIANGADVDAVAYNDFTPLHLTSSLDIVERLLRSKPRLNAKYPTATHRALGELAHAHNDVTRRKWRAIVNALLAAGAKHDIEVAIHLNQLDRVKQLVDVSPELADEFESHSPLRIAASLGRLEICRYLIQYHEVDINDSERGCGYPIIVAALRHPPVVKLLIDSGADLATPISWRCASTGVWFIGSDATVLHHAAGEGATKSVTLLLDAGVDPFATDRDWFDDTRKQTAILVAVRYGRFDNAQAILDHPKFQSAAEATKYPLFDQCLRAAALKGNGYDTRVMGQNEFIKTLLAAGANPDAGRPDATPIQIAAARVHPNDRDKNQQIADIVKLIAAEGGEIDAFSAVAIGDQKRLAECIEKQPNGVNFRSFNGYPALHLAVALDNRAIAQQLLDAGYDVNLRNENTNRGTEQGTALHSAAFWGRTALAKKLLNAGADPKAKSESGETPLDEAQRMNNTEIVKLLSEY